MPFSGLFEHTHAHIPSPGHTNTQYRVLLTKPEALCVGKHRPATPMQTYLSRRGPFLLLFV